MWAEEKLIEAINSHPQLRAIKYGQSRYNHDLISSKEAWREYVNRVYSQMRLYGKRPDVLVFKKEDIQQALPQNIQDISEKNEEEIKDIVFKSIAGIECRSSSYYYKNYVQARRRELSITVKQEDIDRLIKWRDTYCGSKPLFYLQLFFDKGFCISFDKILQIIEQAGRGVRVQGYRYEVDRKTGKPTHFISLSHASECLIAVEHPVVDAVSIKAWNGKIYAIRSPKGGKFKLTDEFAKTLLSLSSNPS